MGAWQAVWRVIFKIQVIFGDRFERRKVDKKNQTYTKTEICKLYILEYFEYFCQMSSKSIRIIRSYTVLKLTRFLRHRLAVVRGDSPFPAGRGHAEDRQTRVASHEVERQVRAAAAANEQQIAVRSLPCRWLRNNSASLARSILNHT